MFLESKLSKTPERLNPSPYVVARLVFKLKRLRALSLNLEEPVSYKGHINESRVTLQVALTGSIKVTMGVLQGFYDIGVLTTRIGFREG